VAEDDRAHLEQAGLKFNAHSLIGGQMAGDSAHRLFLGVSEGNWVEIAPTLLTRSSARRGRQAPSSSAPSRAPTPCSTPSRWGSWPSMPRACAPPTWTFPWTWILYPRGSFALVEHRYEQRRTPQYLELVAGAHASQRARPAVGMIEAAFSKLLRDVVVR